MARPISIAGTASRMNIHFQPARPATPSSCSSAPEIGPAMKLETGIAATKAAVTRPRHCLGNHKVM